MVGYSPWGRKEPDTTEQLHYALCHVNSCKSNVNAIEIVAGLWQTQVLLFRTFWNYFFKFFKSQFLEFAVAFLKLSFYFKSFLWL